MSAAGLDIDEIRRMFANMPLIYRQSVATCVAPFTMAAMIVVGTIVLSRWLPGLVPVGVPAWLVPTIGSLIAACIAGQAWMRRVSTRLIVERTMLRFESGILTRSAHQSAIGQIVSIDSTYGIGGQSIGIGTLFITTTGSETVTCQNIESPQEVVYLVTHMMEALQALGPLGLSHLETYGRRQA
jgi:hypothetical protein